MVTPFMALIIVIIAVVFFLVKAGKKQAREGT
jgi:cbb3-type cytochrome oxidase subunit 3